VLIESGIKLLFKKPFLNLIIIIQISVTVLITNFIVGCYNLYNEAFTLTKNFPPQQTYFIMPGFNAAPNIEKTQEILNKYKNELTVEQPIIHEVLVDNKQYLTISYGEKTSEYLRIPLKKGCWYTETESADYVPCVVRGDYEVGDIIRLPINYEKIEIDKSLISKEELSDNPNLKPRTEAEPVSINFKVCGVLEDKYRILTFATASNNLTLERLFDKIARTPILLVSQKDLSKFDINIDFYPNKNCICFMQTEDPKIKQQIADDFKAQSWVVPFEYAYDESKNELSLNIETLIPLMISIFFIGLVSAVCLTLLNAYNHIRIFSIYYICGMNWKSGFLLILSYVMCLLCSATFVFTGLIILFGNSLNTIIINSWNVIFTVAILVLFAVISLAAPYFLLKKEQPLKQLKQGW
jgi:hypothetical protein